METTKENLNISYSILDRPDQEKKCPIVIRSRQNSEKEIVKFTSLKATKREWDKKGRYKLDAKANAKLNELRERITGSYKDLFEQGLIPTLETAWTNMKENGYSPRPQGAEVLDWIDDYIKKTKDSEGKKKGVKTLRSNLEQWNPKLKFSALSTGVLTRFVDWLNENGVANNSAYKRLRSLNVVARYASQSVEIKEDLFRYKLPYSTRNGSVPRLTYQEVMKVRETDAVGLEAIAKDVFLLACFTGLRIQDILTIREAELGEFHLEKFQDKTGQTVSVTLHKYNESLVRRYHAIGIKYTRQTLSGKLKEVLKRAKLTGNVIKRTDQGSKTIMDSKEKYKLISFHSGRRFYARLLNDMGLGMEIARDELGHSARNVTEHYAGSPDHRLRISRVREAMKKMEKTMQSIALMKVA